MWQYNYTVNSNELYHHGILGMRWGKKNGPPYPLDSSDHSASEKKAGWKKSLDNDSNNSNKKKKRSEKDAAKAAKKLAKQKFKEDVKEAKTNGLKIDFEVDKNGVLDVAKMYDSRGNEMGEEYANKIMRSAIRDKAVKDLVSATVLSAGAVFVASMLSL